MACCCNQSPAPGHIVPDGSSAQRMSIPTSRRAGTVFMLLFLLRGATVSCWGAAAFKCLGTGWGGGEAGRVFVPFSSAVALCFLEAFCIRHTSIVQLLKKQSCCIAQLCCEAAPEWGLGEQPLSSPWAVVGCPAALTPFSRLRHDGDLLSSLLGLCWGQTISLLREEVAPLLQAQLFSLGALGQWEIASGRKLSNVPLTLCNGSRSFSLGFLQRAEPSCAGSGHRE